MLEASRSMESLTAIPGVKLNIKARDVTIARLNYMQVRKLGGRIREVGEQ